MPTTLVKPSMLGAGGAPAIKLKSWDPSARPCALGGTTCQFDLEATIPGETDDIGRFHQFELIVEAQRGIKDVHLRRDRLRPEVCVHYDPAVIMLPQVLALVRQSGVTVSGRYLEKTFFVRGMDAPQCTTIIEYALMRMKGMLSATVAYASERLVIEYDSDELKLAQVEKRVAALGFELEIPSAGHACSHHAHGGGLAPRLEVPLTVLSAVLLVTGYCLERWMPQLPAYVAPVLYGVAMLSAGFFSIRDAAQSIMQRRVDIESLMLLAAVGAALLGAWFEGAFLLLLFSVGHALEHRAMDRARRSVEALSQLRPATARVKRGAELVEVKIELVQRGDIVVVRPGDRIPLDGTVRDGESSVDQAAVTGESIPVPKRAGDGVFSGTVNTDGALEIEVTKLSYESTLARIVDMVSQAEAQKSPAQRFASKLERRFVPLVLVAVVVLPVVLVLLGTPLREAILRAVSLLVAASPCALAISTPAAILSAVAAAAHSGVLIKGGAYLEDLGRVRSIAFDKTGTLTEGKPKLVSAVALDGVAREELLRVAASAEALSAHPLARAVIEAARGLTLTPATDLQAVHGRGLRAKVGTEDVLIGSRALFDELPKAVATLVGKLEAEGQTTMIVQRGSKFLGVLGLADTMRTDAKASIAALRKLGIKKVLMLSGDNIQVATAVGQSVGVDEVRAPLMPDGKVIAIRELARHGGVAMVGDGVNDAPALAAATVGIAMGHAGQDVALETADVVLMADDLRKLAFAVKLSRATVAVIRQNLIIAIGVSLCLIVASVLGLTRISQAVVLHEGSTVVVVLNGLRLLRLRDR